MNLGCGYNGTDSVRVSTSDSSTISDEMSATLLSYLEEDCVCLFACFFVFSGFCFVCLFFSFLCVSFTFPFFHLPVCVPSSRRPCPPMCCGLGHHLSASPGIRVRLLCDCHIIKDHRDGDIPGTGTPLHLPSNAGVWFVKLPVFRDWAPTTEPQTRPGRYPNHFFLLDHGAVDLPHSYKNPPRSTVYPVTYFSAFTTAHTVRIPKT